MKKLLFGTVSVVICLILSIGIFAMEKGDYGYCDTNHNGKIEFSEATELLHDALNTPKSEVTIIRVLHSIQAAVASETVSATITSIDTSALTATISTEYFENITVPLSVFGLDGDANAADFAGVPAVISIHGPAKTFKDRYNGSTDGIYAAEANLVLEGTPANTDRGILSMDQLNTSVVNGSHANDSMNATSLVMSYRDTAVLSSDTTGSFRYDTAWYPRVRKVNDNLYLLVYMYTQFGQHLYYVTSTDGTNWNAPQVLWNSAHYPAFTYEDGELAGTSDRYHAMNPDICVLDDGSVICVYAVRAVKGYRYYPDYSGLFMKRGTPAADGTISWSEETKIYTGQVWEPSIMQRSDGQIHVYFTQVAPDIVQYGYDESHRSTETGLIVSNDNGDTWTPNIQAGDTNYYRATTIYREYVGDKLDAYSNKYRPHYGGQMPVATELYNGRLLLVAEIKTLSGSFRVSYGLSQNNGNWKALAENEEGSYTKLTDTARSSPYVDRFPSGEIYLTYNYWHNGADHLIGRLGKPDASSFGDFFYNAPYSTGIWGSCSVVNSHKAATVMQHQGTATDENGKTVEKNTIHVYYHYLNHRINAKKIAVNVDGYRNEWALNTDALFVGAASQAQAALQVAHDKDNIYFLINRLDYYLSKSGEVSTVYIAASNNTYYRIDITDRTKAYTICLVDASGNKTQKTSGTTVYTVANGNFIDGNLDRGFLTELSVPKSALGIENATSIRAGIGITSVDKGVTTTDVMVDLTSTVNWPTVVLDD
ncbi:MAG: exo-alpha-sialidase [Ruminococcaceae bacterium]|nr:exo-alpha-sialidase [Oscillospiraceae bacterium]